MMDQKVRELEPLLLKSFDSAVTPAEQQLLTSTIQSDFVFRRNCDQFQRIRNALLRKEPDSFGPFFAERIMNMLRQRTKDLDYQILFFFKKYQVLVIGIIVALIIANLVLSDELSLRAFFGLEADKEEGVFSIDVYDNLPD